MNLNVAFGQINPTIGDVPGNAENVVSTYQNAVNQGADLVLFPELCLTGYPPQDLLYRDELHRSCDAHVAALAGRTDDTTMVIGAPRREDHDGRDLLYNAVYVLRNGERRAVADKCLLPTYDVFDEDRYFRPGRSVRCVDLDGQTVALTVCEDLWPQEFLPEGVTYDFDPVEELKEKRPDLVVNVAASPYWMGKTKNRHRIFSRLAADLDAPVAYCNTVGANDEIIFDGQSLFVTPHEGPTAMAEAFEEDLMLVSSDGSSTEEVTDVASASQREDHLLQALERGLRDYVTKCGFDEVLLGLSGGIDSGMTACVAARALGPENVLGVSMPTRYTSGDSKSDAERLATNLGISFREIEIEPIFQTFLKELDPVFGDRDPGVAAENLQARIRGNLLMAISNHTGRLLLATGNKSELSVGYCTLYGDMAGGIAPIGDVPKTLVYDLAERINEKNGEAVVPERILEKPPSAELRPDQTDQDTLPPYEVLDDILQAYIVDQRDLSYIIDDVSDEDLVRDMVRRVDRNEFKRQQAAPVLKVTSRAFGIGRHMPIAKRVRFDADNVEL